MNQTYGRIFCLIGLTILIISQCHAQWVQTNGVTGGSVNSMAVCGTDIYAGTDTVFHSTDNGISWISISEARPIWALGAIHNKVGGTNIFIADYGVFRSTDNGANWTRILFAPQTYFYAITVSDTNVFLGSTEGVFLSGMPHC